MDLNSLECFKPAPTVAGNMIPELDDAAKDQHSTASNKSSTTILQKARLV